MDRVSISQDKENWLAITAIQSGTRCRIEAQAQCFPEPQDMYHQDASKMGCSSGCLLLTSRGSARILRWAGERHNPRILKQAASQGELRVQVTLARKRQDGPRWRPRAAMSALGPHPDGEVTNIPSASARCCDQPSQPATPVTANHCRSQRGHLECTALAEFCKAQELHYRLCPHSCVIPDTMARKHCLCGYPIAL